jgi:hypothetical protein
MAMNKDIQTILDEIVRDFTQATPHPKSEVRQRILQLLESHNQELIKAIEGMPIRHDGTREPRSYNQALQEVINLINNGKLSKT